MRAQRIKHRQGLKVDDMLSVLVKNSLQQRYRMIFVAQVTVNNVRWGMVYRSGDLFNLTARDYQYLDSLGIRLVCDLRTDGDRKRSPTRWTGHMPEFLSTPVGRERDIKLAPEDLKRQLLPQSKSEVSGYDQYTIECAPQYGIILRRLATGDLPTVEHCGSGKDRTGVFSAILLTALGVPREAVIQDYLLTAQYVLAAGSIERTTSDLQRILGLSQRPDASYVRAKMSTRRETLDATFDSITRTFGSFDAYLRNGLNVSGLLEP